MLSKYKKQVIDGAVLRYIAVVAMFTDHLAFCLEGMLPPALYTAGRCIGRIAYPIFAYCLVSGYFHTHDIRRYAGRILAAALISEIPFNLMYSSSVLYPDAQNVMWTLLIALGMLWACGKCRRAVYMRLKNPWLVLGICQLAIAGMACLTASALRTDYGAEGILIVAAFALMPRGIFDIPRGSYPRYLFYAFYPVHMLFIFMVRCAYRL